ncbi:homeobox protein engrailed-2b-like [Anopheles maculipalpis]|uniref:homeobox protein engrailed-2b-like n=1 Tax=Anopheles maculipalpis TaxID=1496333 RepID=UPI00215906A7|nr:homeobox protein engrailed-2b-like [Anopheles maculipalpis]
MAASSCKSVAPLRQSDFSIEHILTRAGERYSKRRKLTTSPNCRNCCTSSPGSDRSDDADGSDEVARLHDETGTEPDDDLEEVIDVGQSVRASDAGFLPTVPGCSMPTFDWLYYTRYHPPKLPRPQKSGPVKRTPGRLPRVPFTPAQLSALEDAYKVSTYLSSEEANQLAYSLELTNTRVKIWFQNRRARDRREKREASLATGGSMYTDPSPISLPSLGGGSNATMQTSVVHNNSRTGSSHPSSPSSVEATVSRQSRSPTTDRSY